MSALNLSNRPESLEAENIEISLPPSNLWSDEPPLESDLHLLQIKILLDCLNWLWREKNNFYASGNLTIYYNPQKIKTRDFRGPDFFVVLDVERKPRRSWTVWDEGGKYPNVIIEILSKSTATVDRGLKKQLYQDIFRTPDYFSFDPETLEFAGFHLVDGTYQPLEANPQGWLWSHQLELFLGIHQSQLRFFTPPGELVPRPEEVADLAQQDADLANQRADRLAAKLRELGVDPDCL
jgi:Uma2 family endonuclease